MLTGGGEEEHASLDSYPSCFSAAGKTDGPILSSYGAIPPRTPFSAHFAEKYVVMLRHDEN